MWFTKYVCKHNSYLESNGPENVYAVRTHRNQPGPGTLATTTNARLLQFEPANAHNLIKIAVIF